MTGGTATEEFQQWCDGHMAELEAHRDEFIAVSLTDGIVAASGDQEHFQAQLKGLDQQKRSELFLAHTATLLAAGGRRVEPTKPDTLGKCRRLGRRFATYCAGMKEALKWQTEEGKGLSELHGFVEGASDVQLLGVAYRNKARAEGAVLNVCPWCGESLRWWPTVVEGHATEGA
jgi:hypothetical protein